MIAALTLTFFFLEASGSLRYDFTFYKTSDDTLASFNSKDVGIDITGYGFIGEKSNRGIYLRVGIQTPFETLLKLKDLLLENKSENTNTAETTDDTTTQESSSILSDDTTQSKDESTKKDEVDTSKWKFLFSIGPAYRSPMGENALVYSGVGFTFSSEIINNIFSGSTSSSLSVMLSLDLDAGFRVGLTHSNTTIRIGVHSITKILGYYKETQYITNEKEKKEESDKTNFYGYIAGKDLIMGATTLRGYIRLATTFRGRREIVYNYSNKGERLGRGVITEAR